MIKKALRGVKVEVTHRGNMHRKYSISGLTSQPTQALKFPLDDKSTMKSVVEYFQETYGYTICYPQLPCLQVGKPQKLTYLPMEVCKIVKGQRYSKQLNDGQTDAMLRATCQRPWDREKGILQIVSHNAYHQDDYAKEFGIKIRNKLATVEARILHPPQLQYHDSGMERLCTPQVGQWNMINKAFNPNPIIPIFMGQPEQVENELKHMHQYAKSKLMEEQLQLLIVILPHKDVSLYGDVKRICETDLGILSQCCLRNHVKTRNIQYMANIALKINVKVGGRNTVLVDALRRNIPYVSDIPTIIFGADVTHPTSGEDSTPSIAAVVASQDWPEVTNYAGLVSAQACRQELIADAMGMIRELMITFYKATGQKPKRIIFYRDGVSDGQFNQVLLHELGAIHKACASLESCYLPPVTFVVVQKHHNTRLFAKNHHDKNTVDGSGNILPGTVVDSKICHPTEFDFYLCSHAGVKGTSRPAHYHVLFDENNFTADGLQSLTNNLCYTYARCTRSVSIVPPAYYAHLAAFRARCYMQRESPDSRCSPVGVSGKNMASDSKISPAKNMPSSSAFPSTRLPSEAPLRPLPAIKENVKKVMFYC